MVSGSRRFTGQVPAILGSRGTPAQDEPDQNEDQTESDTGIEEVFEGLSEDAVTAPPDLEHPDDAKNLDERTQKPKCRAESWMHWGRPRAFVQTFGNS
jgi:hypothetical protein